MTAVGLIGGDLASVALDCGRERCTGTAGEALFGFGLTGERPSSGIGEFGERLCEALTCDADLRLVLVATLEDSRHDAMK